MKIKSLLASLIVLTGLALGQSQFNGGTATGAKINGTPVASDCASWFNSTTLQDSGGACGGSPAFNTVGAGSNTNVLTVGTGGSLTPVGTGTIGANVFYVGSSTFTSGSVPFAGPGGVANQDNANFSYNAGTHTLSVANEVLTGTLTTSMSGGPFCVQETAGVLAQTSATCGGISGTVANPAFFNGTNSVTSPAYIYASSVGFQSSPTPYAGDYCLLLHNVITQAASAPYSTASPTIYWDIPGQLKCASPPFGTYNDGSAAQNFTGQILFTVPVAFWMSGTAQVVIPQNMSMYGLGQPTFGENASSGTAFVACNTINTPNSTVCPAVFPNDTPLSCFISCSYASNYSGAGKDTQIWWMAFDCFYVQGCRAHVNYYAQENAGLHWVYLFNWANNGIAMDVGNSYFSGGGGASQNSTYEGLMIGNNNAGAILTPNKRICTPGALGMRFAYNSFSFAGPRRVSDYTISYTDCAVTTATTGHDGTGTRGIAIYPSHATEINGGDIALKDFHDEWLGESANVIGKFTALGTMTCVNGTGVCTYVSGDTPFVNGAQPWANNAAACGPFVIFTGYNGAAAPFQSTASTSCNGATNTVSFGAGNVPSGTFPYSYDSIGQTGAVQLYGAEHIQIINGNLCCTSVASGAGTACAGAACTALTNCITCVTNFFNLIGPGAASNTQDVMIDNIKLLLPGRATVMGLDGFRGVQIGTASSVLDLDSPGYISDHNNNITGDDSGTNVQMIKGGAQVFGHLNQQAVNQFGGSCTQSSGTCTWTLSKSFTAGTQLCIPFKVSGTVTGVLSCSASGTTVTITDTVTTDTGVTGSIIIGTAYN